LFRTAAIRLQAQVQNLKAELAQDQDNPQGAEATIRKNINEALQALNTTQTSFRELAGGNAQPEVEQAFFDDLRRSYQDVLNELNPDQQKAGFGSAPVQVSFPSATQNKKSQATYAILARAALRPFEKNELAYNLVADSQSLTFDLDVKSNPEGATICAYRRGDACHANADPTNTVLKSLPLAVWIVRFQKPGYKTEEREHDPFTEPNHVLNVELTTDR
jgi:hypothetical protein